MVNQVVWQRALKIFLGGSETLSAMVVVLVFLLGLGLGSGLAARWSASLRRPLLALALVELALALGNTLVAVLLSLDVTESVYAVQRLALSSGVPLRAVYALGSAALLLPPTVLMGATMPLASESGQRQLGGQQHGGALVHALLTVNTVGAALGAFAASAWLLPAVGQRGSLLCAVAGNAAAAVAIGLVAARAGAVAPGASAKVSGPWTPSREEALGGVLGFLALGYEMVLFRILAMSHKPVPTTFATGLCGFLLAWSLGVALASRVRGGTAGIAALGAVSVALVPLWFQLDLLVDPLPMPVAAGLYVSPCVAFGLLYGQLVTRAASDWGRDVGRYSLVNTLGSCVGILFFTLVGYEQPQTLTALVLAAGLVAAAASEVAAGPLRAPARALGGLAVVGAVAALGVGLSLPYTVEQGLRTYWGRDGVVQVADDGNVYIDGLWHTKLTDGRDHVGQPYSWLMALAAVLAHPDTRPDRALVVGAGVGISGITLAGLQGLAVDGYEIDHTMKRVLRDYRAQTLDAGYSPGMTWRWQDARVGLALDPTRYDVILSAPLYLRQAGSSLLLSREYLRLVKSRLEPDGVLAVYSNEGSPAQTRLVQATLDELFAYRVTWYDGTVTVASDRPIALTKERFLERLSAPDRIFQEARLLDAELAPEGGLWSWYDGDKYTRILADRVITDDQPLVEYPELADRWVGTRPASPRE